MKFRKMSQNKMQLDAYVRKCPEQLFIYAADIPTITYSLGKFKSSTLQ